MPVAEVSVRLTPMLGQLGALGEKMEVGKGAWKKPQRGRQACVPGIRRNTLVTGRHSAGDPW